MTTDPITRPQAVPTFALALAGTVVGTMLLFAGVSIVGVMSSAVFDGLPAVLNVACATAFGLAISRRIAPESPISLQIATGGGIGLGVLSTLVLLLGLAGWLSMGVGIGLPLGMGIIGVADWLRRSRLSGQIAICPLENEADDTPQIARWLWLLPAIALGMAIVAAAMPVGMLWGSEPNAYDVVSYHLQVPREWFEADRIFPLDHNVFSRFPLANEMFFLLAMHQRGGAVDGALQSQFTNAAISCLMVLAVFGGIRGIGQSRTIATAGAAVVATLPWTIMLSAIAYNEPLLMLAGALTIAWLVRAVQSGAWRDALLAGLMAGLGAAAKPTGVPLLIVAGGMALLAGFLATFKEKPAMFRPLLAFAIAAVIFPLAWWIKNAIWFGNPVSPLAAGVFGGVDGWSVEQVQRWDSAHSLPLSNVPQQLWAEVFGSVNFAWLLWPMAFVGFFWGIVDKRTRPVAIALGIMVIAAIGVWSFSTHMIGRFMVIAIPSAVMLAVVAMRRPSIAMAGGAVSGTVGLLFTVFVVAGMPAVASLNLPASRGLWGLLDRSATMQGTLPAGVPLMSAQSPFVDEAQRLALDPPAPPRYGLAFAQGKDVYLVGDASAFLYPITSENLHYRGVFDVPPADGALRAWLGDALETAPDDALVVIDLAEVQRLATTYGTPALEVDIAADPFSPVPPKRVLTMAEIHQLLK